jgi:hypothetical protein
MLHFLARWNGYTNRKVLDLKMFILYLQSQVNCFLCIQHDANIQLMFFHVRSCSQLLSDVVVWHCLPCWNVHIILANRYIFNPLYFQRFWCTYQLIAASQILTRWLFYSNGGICSQGLSIVTDFFSTVSNYVTMSIFSECHLCGEFSCWSQSCICISIDKYVALWPGGPGFQYCK